MRTRLDEIVEEVAREFSTLNGFTAMYREHIALERAFRHGVEVRNSLCGCNAGYSGSVQPAPCAPVVPLPPCTCKIDWRCARHNLVRNERRKKIRRGGCEINGTLGVIEIFRLGMGPEEWSADRRVKDRRKS